MAGFGESSRFNAMFENGNRVRFERPVDDQAREWWMEAFYTPFDLTPEGMGDLLTRSVSNEKSITYRHIDGHDHSFRLRVEGRFGEGGIWFVERSLELDGSVFNAEAMFIPPPDAQSGRGRLLMADLLQASQKLGIARISIESERIGRYAWLRVGFVPDRRSWRDIQVEALRYIQRNSSALGSRAEELIKAVSSGGPSTARWLAALRDPVPSRELFDEHGNPRNMPLGKAFFFEVAPNWTGTFSFDPESMSIAHAYIERG